MISVFACIAQQHDWRFLAAAVLICIIGCATTIFLLTRIEDCHPAHRNLWMAAAGLGNMVDPFPVDTRL